MRPYKWKTIWVGNAVADNIIETNIDLSKIKGIRFSWNRSNNINQLFQPDTKAFLDKKQVETSVTRFEWNFLVKFVDLALTLQDVSTGKIKVDRGGYCYKYTNDNSFTWNNNHYSFVNRVEILK